MRTVSAPAVDTVSGRGTNTDGAVTTLIAAQGANTKTWITDVSIANTSATTITVDLLDDATVIFTFIAPAGGGVVHAFATELPGTANKAWKFQGSAAVTTLTCSANGFLTKT